MLPTIKTALFTIDTQQLCNVLGSIFAIVYIWLELYVTFVKKKKVVYFLKYHVIVTASLVIVLLLGTILNAIIRGFQADIVSTGFVDKLREAVSYKGSHFIGCVIAMAVLLPIVFFIFYKKKNAFKLLSITAYFVPIQHLFNRLGCFFHGCCVGIPMDGIFTVKFKGMNHYVFPSQLFEAGLMLILFVIQIILTKKKRNIFIFTNTYFSVAIFVSEFFIDDSFLSRYGNLTPIQIAALFLFAFSLLSLIIKKMLIKR